MTAPPQTQRAATSQAAWSGRLLAGARFGALLYLFVVAGLLLGTLVPAVVVRWQPLAVVSGSMQPAIRSGAMVLVEPATPDRFYDHPTVVAYPDPARPERLVTHRVVAASTDGTGAVSYTTKGDANRVPDSDAVPHEAVIGSVRMVVPFVGLPALWLRHGNLGALTAWALVSLLAAGALLRQPGS